MIQWQNTEICVASFINSCHMSSLINLFALEKLDFVMYMEARVPQQQIWSSLMLSYHKHLSFNCSAHYWGHSYFMIFEKTPLSMFSSCFPWFIFVRTVPSHGGIFCQRLLPLHFNHNGDLALKCDLVITFDGGSYWPKINEPELQFQWSFQGYPLLIQNADHLHTLTLTIGKTPHSNYNVKLEVANKKYHHRKELS